MDVDVDRRRIQVQEQHVGRMPSVVQDIGIGLAHRVRDDPVAHRPAVDVEILQVGLAPGAGRRPEQAAQAHAGGVHRDLDGGPDESGIEQLRQPQRIERPARGLQHQHRAAVVAEPETDARPAQGNGAQPVLDVAELGALGAQELAPRRDVEEQVADLDRGADRVRRRRRRADATVLGVDPPAVVVAGGARDQGETGDRGDRGQGLAPEAQAGDPQQVVEVGDLGGGVAGQGQGQLPGRDADAVVAHPHQPGTAGLDLDLDAVGAGIQGVVQQFPDHGGRPLHHLAGGDLVDQGIGQDADGHGRGARGLRL